MPLTLTQRRVVQVLGTILILDWIGVYVTILFPCEAWPRALLTIYLALSPLTIMSLFSLDSMDTNYKVTLSGIFLGFVFIILPVNGIDTKNYKIPSTIMSLIILGQVLTFLVGVILRLCYRIVKTSREPEILRINPPQYSGSNEQV